MTKAVDVSVDARDFVRVLGQAKEFDKKLYTGLRRGIREMGAAAVADVKAEVKKDPLSGPVKRHTGLRLALAKGVKVSISASPSSRKVGAFIDSKGSSPASKVLKRKWDSPKGFRHPVFADAKNRTRKEWKWAPQKGRPYFSTVLEGRRPQMERDIRKLLDRTLDQVELRK